MCNYIKVLSGYKFKISHSIHTKSNKWNQNVIKFLSRQKYISFLKCIYYIIHTIYIYIYKSFSATLDKGLRKNIKKTEIGKHKLNEMGALNIK